MLKHPISYPYSGAPGNMVNRALLQPYDGKDEGQRLYDCFMADPAVREIMWEEDEFFKKYGRL